MDITIYRRHSDRCPEKQDRYTPLRLPTLVPIQLETGFYDAKRQQAKAGSKQVGRQYSVVVRGSDQL
jgi:hypothetical protein